MAKLLMRDIPIGNMVFTITRFDEYNEIRETYYTRIGETEYLHHGCIQGNPNSEERPRYVKINTDGFKYPLVPTLPIHPRNNTEWKKLIHLYFPL